MNIKMNIKKTLKKNSIINYIYSRCQNVKAIEISVHRTVKWSLATLVAAFILFVCLLSTKNRIFVTHFWVCERYCEKWLKYKNKEKIIKQIKKHTYNM